jgi:hypothetical protein
MKIRLRYRAATIAIDKVSEAESEAFRSIIAVSG